MSAAEPGRRFTAPDSVEAYRTIGPFDTAGLPAGLLKEHRLKEGTWARLTVLSGEIGFAWDDTANEGEAVVLREGESIDVPPTVPHHLEVQDGDFSIELTFLAEPDSQR
ncbi:DUF1971 domain-containing protein [Aurantiacibacter hainanensis]|uniref:DUF1971 domain-containing protein n=1 Tax=Aurantiacibacter hainanensis TaxID=3076114 RepID=UPI0030C6E12F